MILRFIYHVFWIFVGGAAGYWIGTCKLVVKNVAGVDREKLKVSVGVDFKSMVEVGGLAVYFGEGVNTRYGAILGSGLDYPVLMTESIDGSTLSSATIAGQGGGMLSLDFDDSGKFKTIGLTLVDSDSIRLLIDLNADGVYEVEELMRTDNNESSVTFTLKGIKYPYRISDGVPFIFKDEDWVEIEKEGFGFRIKDLEEQQPKGKQPKESHNL